MNQYNSQLASTYGSAPGKVKAATGGPYAGISVALRLITGNPDKVEGYAPLYETVGSQVSTLAERVGAVGQGIGSWGGEAREQFNAKVESIQSELASLAPEISRTSGMLQQAAQAARQAGETIVTFFRTLITELTASLAAAMAAAASSFGASLVKWFAQAVAKAAQVLQRVLQVAQKVGSMLDRLGQTLRAIGEGISRLKDRLKSLVASLDIPGRAQSIAETVMDSVAEPAKNLWEDLKAEVKTSFEGSRDWLSGGPKNETDSSDPSFKLKLREGEGFWGHEATGSGEHQLDDGSMLTGSFEARNGLSTKGNVFASDEGIGAEASAKYALGSIKGEGAWESANGLTSLQGKGEAYVGAEAKADGEITRSGIDAGAEAFMGAKAEASATGEVAGFESTVKGEAWAGLGVEGDVTAKWDDGKLTFGAEGGAALGLGGKLGFEQSIDFNAVGENLSNAGRSIGDFFSN